MSAITPSTPRRPRRSAPTPRPPRGRAPAGGDPAVIDPLRARHLALERAAIEQGGRRVSALVNAAESPLMWLARRKGRDGRPLIAPEQFAAGERLRADFTRAQMTPRVTADWTAPVAGGRRGDAAAPQFTEAVTAARQRVRRALDAAGPEFSGLLVDVCCFLKGLDDVERERQWPSRAAKVVLQLGLDRLARHYGYDAVPRGGTRPRLRAWRADGAAEEA